MRTTTLATLLAVALHNIPAAYAELVTFQVTATVDTVDDPNWLLGGSILVGDTLEGTLQYDTSLPDLEPDANLGTYFASPPGGSFIEGTSSASGFFETIDFFDAVVGNGPTSGDEDFVVFFATGDTTPSTLVHPSVDWVDLAVVLYDFDGTVFSNDSLPTTLDLAEFELAEVELTSEDDQNFIYAVTATITDIAQVPEPSTLLLGAVAAIGLLLGTHVRRTQRRF